MSLCSFSRATLSSENLDLNKQEMITESNLWRYTEDIAQEYQFVEMICNSVQGAVYKAVWKLNGELVAAKVASKKLVAERASREGFAVVENILQEALILKQLQGAQGVIEFVDALEDDSFFYLITKFEAGGDLFDFLSKNIDSMTEQEALDIFFFLCRTVSRLHDEGVCHLDISLENVFISNSGELKLGDFGVARLFSTHHIRSPTRIGKPKYMAPEIVEGLEFDGFQADVYSLGVVLFCLLYGTHPYQTPADDQIGFVLIPNGLFRDFLQISGLEGLKSRFAEDLLQMMLAPPEDRSSIQVILAEVSRMIV